MMSQQECPSSAQWRQILEGPMPGSSADAWSEHLERCGRCHAVVEELTRGGRTWLEVAAELCRPASPLPPACQRVLEDARKQAPAAPSPHGGPSCSEGGVTHGFSGSSIWRRPIMTACIHLERMMHRQSLAVRGEAAATYALVKLIPSGAGGAAPPLGLNLALALDVSGSMYEEDGTGVSRLQRIQDAASQALQSLKPSDTLAVVAFAHDALVLLPPTALAEKARIEEVIRTIDRCDVDPGGTAMDEGLSLALREVEQRAGAGTLSQVVVLTDGETTGEQRCRLLAQQAAQKKILLSLMGVGTDWKASLLKDLARISQGKWSYIDEKEKLEAQRVFAEEFQALAATGFKDVEMHLRLMKEVKLTRLRMVVPEIKELTLQEVRERHLMAALGTLQNDQARRYVLDLTVPPRADSKYILAQLEVTYDTGRGQRDSTGLVPLEMEYTAAGHGYVNAEVMKHIDDVRLKDMNDELQRTLESHDQQRAAQLAREIVKQGEQMGEQAVRKTQLARQMLQELSTEGVAARRTQLALEDEARKVEMPLESAVGPGSANKMPPAGQAGAK
jgi:Ca-activated chloride channel family protein